MHVGSPGKKSKTEAMYCPARNGECEAGDTSDLILDCGGTVSFTQPFAYLASLLHRDLPDHHDVDARIKKASKGFGALRDRIFSTRDASERLKREDLHCWCSGGAAVWVQIVVPHGRVQRSLAQLAQQAHTRDLQGDFVSIVRPSNIFGNLAKAYRCILD
jgi:hypothetical protein